MIQKASESFFFILRRISLSKFYNSYCLLFFEIEYKIILNLLIDWFTPVYFAFSSMQGSQNFFSRLGLWTSVIFGFSQDPISLWNWESCTLLMHEKFKELRLHLVSQIPWIFSLDLLQAMLAIIEILCLI